MLVLSRKVNESIRIDGEIEIKVLSSTGNRVRLGITAPQNTPVNRSEKLGIDRGTPEGATLIANRTAVSASRDDSSMAQVTS